MGSLGLIWSCRTVPHARLTTANKALANVTPCCLQVIRSRFDSSTVKDRVGTTVVAVSRTDPADDDENAVEQGGRGNV